MKKRHPIGPLFTDLYELTMAAAYFDHQVVSEATFSLFIRDHKKRNYFVSAGLEDALNELSSFRFSDEDRMYLKGTGLFSEAFLSYLKSFCFSGTVHAMAEGTICFSDEPVLEVTAPLIEAQLIETFLINTIGFQTLIATKAARCVHAGGAKPLIDFSLRRTQGHDAGMKVARSTYITGFKATSNVLAGKVYGIPVSGTMAHSYVSVFDNEADAFSAFSKTFPENSVFLIDTYDTLEGAKHAATIAAEMKKRGLPLIGVRLDSGDMALLSRQVRSILDNAGLHEIKIFASSGFDEHKIAHVISTGAKIDAFGVGTKMGVSADAPYLDIVYKLVRYRGQDVRKLSIGKVTLAGEKQVFRKSDPNGHYVEDVIGLRDDRIVGGIPLLEKVMTEGNIYRPLPSLNKIRDSFEKSFSSLPQQYKSIHEKIIYPVRISPRLQEIQNNG